LAKYFLRGNYSTIEETADVSSYSAYFIRSLLFDLPHITCGFLHF